MKLQQVISSIGAFAVAAFAVGGAHANSVSPAPAHRFDVHGGAEPPGLTKSFTPDAIAVGGVSVLTIEITNPNASPGFIMADLTDTLPGTMVVADPAAAASNCDLGAVSAMPGSNTVTLLAGAGIPSNGACEIVVAVTSATAGTLQNVIPAGAVQANYGSNPTAATATLTVGGGAAPGLDVVDTFDLPAGDDLLRIGLADPAGDYAYFVTSTLQPSRIVKIRLPTLERVAAIDLEADEYGAATGVIDPVAGRYAYIATSDAPVKIVKIDLLSMTRVGSETPPGLSAYNSSVIDPEGAAAYFGGEDGQVVKLDLGTFTVTDVINVGQPFLRSAAIDPAGAYAYFVSFNDPSEIVKIDLATFSVADTLELDDTIGLRSATIDPAGEFAYFGSYSWLQPSRIAKVALSTFTEVDTIDLDINESFFGHAAMAPDGSYALFGTTTNPGRVVRIDLASFERMDAVQFRADDLSVGSFVPDWTRGFLYASTVASPGRIEKIALDGTPRPALRFDPADVDFNNVPQNDEATRAIAITNDGTATMSGILFSVPDPAFAVDGSACPATLAVGDSCALSVTYFAGMPGASATQVAVTADGDFTAHMRLRGNSIVSNVGFAFDPPVLDFGAVSLGTTSAALTTTVTNTTSATLSGVFVMPPLPPFAGVGDTCHAPLAPGASCTVSISYSPTVASRSAGSMRVVSIDGTADGQFALTGFGVTQPQQLVAAPSPLDFGDVTTGTLAQRLLTITNFGTDFAASLEYSIDDDRFGVQETCPYIASGGSNCVVLVWLQSEVVGDATAELHVWGDDGAEVRVPLHAHVVGQQTLDLRFEPASVDFGTVEVGSSGAPVIVTLHNTGSADAILALFTPSTPQFRVDWSACGFALPSGATCPLTLTFWPAEEGLVTGSLELQSNDAQTFTLPLSGVGGGPDEIFSNGFD